MCKLVLRSTAQKGSEIMKEKYKAIFEEHLKVLQNAAKKECSGEDLKAITEAIVMVLNLLGCF